VNVAGDNPLMLDPRFSKVRQERMLSTMAERKLDAVVIGDPQHVYYFSSIRPGWLHFSAFILFSDGRRWMTSANSPAQSAAVDEMTSYEASWMATLRQEQPAVAAGQAIEALKGRRAKRVGLDTSAVTSQVVLAGDHEFESIDPVLWQLRRRKDADELALIRKAAACADAMYARARDVISPGVLETDVYAELTAAAIREAGEPMSALLGNDYTCGGGGGSPRAGRRAKAGELYIVDVGPAYRGYFADACRTYSVDRNPTDEQSRATEAILGALNIVEQLAKPGASCREIYETVVDHLKGHPGAIFPHHLGHGIGLQPHEFPHLNPRWDDVLMEGEVFTAEPGLYAPSLAGGIRIENDYVVTSTGVENLVHSPSGLV
jgi:Xaa-Pro dipeptidase